ncbi:N-acetylgalactosaminyl-diphosphoundecaprenol glucuronosyltransferase [Balamuthia mandrillaris]
MRKGSTFSAVAVLLLLLGGSPQVHCRSGVVGAREERSSHRLELPPQARASAFPTSFSVIVPTHNNEAFVIRTLKSVESSIQFFFKHATNSNKALHTILDEEHIALLSKTKAEVVIVDDASTDHTLTKALNFVQRRKQQQQRSGRLSWKVLSLPEQLYGGAARNLGALHSEGEVLFFLDADDLFHREHVLACFPALAAKREELVMAETGVNVELANIHPDWKERIRATIPQNKCLYRNFHDFVEGFPEQEVYRRYDDYGYVRTMALFRTEVFKLDRETVTYKFYPGNSLDKQRKRFEVALEEAGLYEEANTAEDMVRESLLFSHGLHLRDKALAIKQGRAIEENPLWAIHSYLVKQARKSGSCENYGRINAHFLKRQRLLDFAEEEEKNGRMQRALWTRQVAATMISPNATQRDGVHGPVQFYIESKR